MYIISFRSEFELLRKLPFGGVKKWRLKPNSSTPHVSSTLKLILLLNNTQNLGYLKGHPFVTHTNTEIVYSILLPWIVFLRNCPFLVK